MDDNTHDLINQLATRAGMLMEDGSVVALTMTKQPSIELIDRIEELECQVQAMSSLLRAARSLCE